MCGTCGCSTPAPPVQTTANPATPDARDAGRDTVPVMEPLLAENDRQAAHNRAHLDAAGVVCVNLMSSPGAGKTTLLEATIKALGLTWRIGVIEGDLETETDAQRIRKAGAVAHQITTGTACHLDAAMVHRALHHLDLASLDLLVIENVGNLVCPACFDLGQHANAVLLSVPEGDDKPAKYPVMFRAADLVLLTKADLLATVGDFAPETAAAHVRALATGVPVVTLSARRPDSLTPWFHWLATLRETRHASGRKTGNAAARGSDSMAPRSGGPIGARIGVRGQ
ncbi:hydrogenase accessory protein HypB [Rhodothalassium salexigens]|uniref:hydrogenase nickel incorporation protein HypB n=1 Tax=Rhodothalassium salexigens TaxID=1086 RepID=UPI0019144080|nr:hydrogenase nickel incorporation protein HypB [Rhodothalassium salexigens]MBK5911111.1 hydrogenase accessory protein HypB [Rhodothalassium salexigens]MBK5919471.1 hydrogenase accessory protein HypB [Rhodothalassium salexigens]